MYLYPELPGPRTAAILRDAAALGVLALLAWLGLAVHDAVDQLAVLGEGVRKAGDAIPLVGGPVEELGERGENGVHRLANVLGLLVFGLPALLVLALWLPGRIAQARRLNEAAHVLADPGAPERRRAIAMRAAFSLPYGRLLAHTRDPLGDLEAARYDALVAAAFEDVGLRPR